jgi:hypothetical protein
LQTSRRKVWRQQHRAPVLLLFLMIMPWPTQWGQQQTSLFLKRLVVLLVSEFIAHTADGFLLGADNHTEPTLEETSKSKDSAEVNLL